ncbi:hypothetical protein [Pseudomonas sp. RIT-To-2]|uniref:hypothetical protein n=1 Tax=Pseudomonas sp. RIT-To-2 TaxID=3462541 RepID=UPI002413A115
MRSIALPAVIVFGLNGCAMNGSVQSDCESNFSTEGSILTGKRFTTVSSLPGIKSDAAYKSLYKILVSDGYYISSADDRKKMISAYQNVNFSDKRAPLNAIVEDASAGAQVRLVFVASAGIYTPEAGAEKEFCKIISRIQR